MKALLRHIIWQGQGRLPFIFAGVGFLLGLTFLLLSVQLYNRVYSGIRADLESGELSRYLVLHKRIGTAQVMGKASSNFNDKELAEIAEQPFVLELAPFKGNSFAAAMTMEQIQDMQVLLPLESVEDRFLDTIPNGWEWDPSDERIPVIISSEFLNLYNAVLAPSMNYPRFTREFVQQYSLEILLMGNGRQRSMKIKVVGFSDRILSVLVPDEFLTWANNEYGSGDRKEYARAIAQVADPGDPKLQQFLKKHDYETSQDSLKGTAAGALQALLGIMAFLGLSFFVLATIIFLMAFELTIARARQEIDLLIQLGHTLPSLTYAVAGTFVPAVLGISTVSIGLLIVVVRLLSSKIVEQGLIIAPGIWWGVWLSAVIFVGATIGLSILRIWRSLVALAR